VRPGQYLGALLRFAEVRDGHRGEDSQDKAQVEGKNETQDQTNWGERSPSTYRLAMNDAQRERREALNNWGADFDGTYWMMVVPALEPVAETVIVCAVDEATVKRSAAPRPTGINFALAETANGPVAVLLVTLIDDLTRPLRLNTMLNPSSDEAVGLMAGLAQEVLQLIFYDRRSGEELGRRLLPIDEDTRAGINEAVARSERYPETTPERWEQAVAVARRAFKL
jgi:hypothetical protein